MIMGDLGTLCGMIVGFKRNTEALPNFLGRIMCPHSEKM
jgi:hypothetical protein